MEEKRKIEKIIFNDLDKAKTTFRQTADKKIIEMQEAIEKGSVAQKLLNEFIVINKKYEEIEEKIKKNGFKIDKYSSKPKIKLSYDFKDPKINNLREKIDENYQKLEDLKRSYTLRLFAGDIETKRLFEVLQEEINRIIKL